MFIVTGGAGLIGSHIVRALNSQGVNDILVVDDLKDSRKFLNLVGCQIADYMDKEEFRNALEGHKFDRPVQAILHQGACTNTMEMDGRYMLDNNFGYSKVLLHYAVRHRIPFVYASSAAVYGTHDHLAEQPANERPLNIYGYSKLLFDQYVRRMLSRADSTIVGLRYFNVYGPHEAHKGKMASMVYQLYHQLRDSGVAGLFQGTGGYDDGEQRRDFVFVEDVAKVNLFFAGGNCIKGIFDLGTGKSRSFNDIARVWISLLGQGEIEYIPFPAELTDKYQSFTQADISSLHEAGYTEAFTSLEGGIEHCFHAW